MVTRPTRSSILISRCHYWEDDEDSDTNSLTDFRADSENIPNSIDSAEIPILNVKIHANDRSITCQVGIDRNIQFNSCFMTSNMDLVTNDQIHRQKIQQSSALKREDYNLIHSISSLENEINNLSHRDTISHGSDNISIKKHHKSRSCLFCGIFQTHLRHKKEEEVTRACNLPKKDQDECCSWRQFLHIKASLIERHCSW